MRRAVHGAALLLAVALAAAPRPSASAPVVELLTIGPGRAIDERFGHSLLRVVDAETQRDEIYDFGVAELRRPDFVAAALMGRATLRLRRAASQPRFEEYVQRGRQIDAERLNLSAEQVAELMARLELNLRPGNAEYVLDPIAENCSTRIRDLLDDVTRGALKRAAYQLPTSHSYREEILAELAGERLASLGFDLAMGPHGEDRVGAWQLSFAPARLREVVAASENSAIGEGVRLVASSAALHRASTEAALAGGAIGARQIAVACGAALGLFFGLIGFAAWLSQNFNRWLSRLAGLVLLPTAALFGLLGAALLPVALFSDSAISVSNQNAWIFFPLDLLLVVPALRWLWTGRASFSAETRVYLDIRFLMLLIGWTGVAWPQDNGAFALAAALALAGLRTMPLRAR
jgi:hypothetical protein